MRQGRCIFREIQHGITLFLQQQSTAEMKILV